MKRRGFTLIELLVVIAIIAILAAILFPVFARAREKARANTCLSNCKQLMLGLLMYVQDYDEMFPAYGGNWDPTTFYNVQLAPYVKNTNLYMCPSDLNVPSPYPWSYSWVVKGDVCRGTNWNVTGIFAYGLNWGWFPVVGLKTLEDPVNSIVMGDGRQNAYCFCYGATNNYSWYGPEPRHNDGINSGWADGHVKFLGIGPRPKPEPNTGTPTWFPIPERFYTWAAD
jgi:prepilin-type N-terminal cleavage/methylation domain-containing protein/prepilin-type processing-associated H-X9-DG protein